MVISHTPPVHSNNIHNISNNLSVNRFSHIGVVCKFVSLLECVIWWLRGTEEGWQGSGGVLVCVGGGGGWHFDMEKESHGRNSV